MIDQIVFLANMITKTCSNPANSSAVTKRLDAIYESDRRLLTYAEPKRAKRVASFMVNKQGVFRVDDGKRAASQKTPCYRTTDSVSRLALPSRSTSRMRAPIWQVESWCAAIFFVGGTDEGFIVSNVTQVASRATLPKKPLRARMQARLVFVQS